MVINNTPISADLGDIIEEWRNQLVANKIPLLGSIRDTPDNIMVSCIYHKGGQERKPSAGISKDTGIYHCFACGEVHTLQEVISHSFGHTDDLIGSWGWNWILKNFLTISVEERKDVNLDFARGPMHPVESVTYVSEEELDSYRYYHPYMYKRKLTDEIIDLFDIGYDKNTECITFPVRDVRGNCLFVARRSVNSKFFNYPAGAEKPVYGLYELFESRKDVSTYLDESGSLVKTTKVKYTYNEIIICESMLDALTCWVYGKSAVALNGLGNDLQFNQLNSMACRKFILATDMDEAGKKARTRLRKHLERKLVTEYVWDVNECKDINDMSKEQFDSLKEVF